VKDIDLRSDDGHATVVCAFLVEAIVSLNWTTPKQQQLIKKYMMSDTYIDDTNDSGSIISKAVIQYIDRELS
jgi:hypothetical protein